MGIHTSSSQFPLVKERRHKWAPRHGNIPALTDPGLHKCIRALGRRGVASAVEVESAADGGRGRLAGLKLYGGCRDRKRASEERSEGEELHFERWGELGNRRRALELGIRSSNGDSRVRLDKRDGRR